ncbi:MAG: hypothetical protein WD226_01345 [Planctomycetota bacterium]
MKVWLTVCLACVALCGARASAQSDAAPVEGRVIAVVGQLVSIDLGLNDGLAIGDRVLVLPLTGLSVDAVVRSVTANDARVELSREADVAVGDPVELALEEAESEDDAARPAHPPWTHPPVDWDAAMPLLSEAYVRPAGARDVDIRARAFVRADMLRGDAETSSTTSFLRTGARWSGTNVFGRAGTLRVDVDAFVRHAEHDERADIDTAGARVDEFSYAWGGDRERPVRWSVGRFLTEGMPEFGRIDGVEWSRRRGNGDRWGVSAGALPLPNARGSSGDDVQLAAWYGFGTERLGRWWSRVGVQKTWHRGEPDRDLVVGSFHARPVDATHVDVTAWVDWYTSSDTTKSSGAELTQLTATVRQELGERSGITLNYDEFRFPELLRDEFPESVLVDLSGREVRRAGARAWHDLTDDTTLDLRLSQWEDEEADGLTGEIGGTVRDAFVEGGRLGLSLFANEARFRDVTGARLRWARNHEWGQWRVDWNTLRFTSRGIEAMLEHVARATVERYFGAAWIVGAHIEHRFGDEQDASAVGFNLERRWR